MGVLVGATVGFPVGTPAVTRQVRRFTKIRSPLVYSTAQRCRRAEGHGSGEYTVAAKLAVPSGLRIKCLWACCGEGRRAAGGRGRVLDSGAGRVSPATFSATQQMAVLFFASTPQGARETFLHPTGHCQSPPPFPGPPGLKHALPCFGSERWSLHVVYGATPAHDGAEAFSKGRAPPTCISKLSMVASAGVYQGSEAKTSTFVKGLRPWRGSSHARWPGLR